MSTAELERKLAERGFTEPERAEALASLRRTGLLDDVRFAESRARSLAGRGAGDALIRFELERAGVPIEIAAGALESLEPESDRASRIVERRGPGPKTVRYLRGKGFAEESIAVFAAENVVATKRPNELG